MTTVSVSVSVTVQYAERSSDALQQATIIKQQQYLATQHNEPGFCLSPWIDTGGVPSSAAFAIDAGSQYLGRPAPLAWRALSPSRGR
eukprot:COSAG06_NODE_721_length_12803_cov_167.866105_7_plen_87_part_00